MNDNLIHTAFYEGRTVVGYMSEQSQCRLDWLIDEYDVRSIIEVGSFVGLSACFFAERVDQVVCVESFDAANSATFNPVGVHVIADQYRTFLANTLAYPNIRHIVLPSLEAAALPLGADMVYIDADHTFEGTVADIEAWRPHANKLIAGDDNGDSRFGVSDALKTLGIPDSGERIW
ncbi:hypothetical protein LCGC14_2909010, partial [marine sediment metagenome]